jgi:hypothetical protein
VSFAAIILYGASQRVFIVVSIYFVIDSVRQLLDAFLYCGVPLVVQCLGLPFANV